MDNLQRIKSFSKKFRIIFIIILVMLPCITFSIWFFFNDLPSTMQTEILSHISIKKSMEFSLNVRLLSIAVSFIPVSIYCYALYILIKLFQSYEQGQFFTPVIVTYYNRFGIILIIAAIADIIYNSLLGIIITYADGPGKRMLSIGLSSNHIFEIFIGCIIICISWIMNEARKLQDEQSLTI